MLHTGMGKLAGEEPKTDLRVYNTRRERAASTASVDRAATRVAAGFYQYDPVPSPGRGWFGTDAEGMW